MTPLHVAVESVRITVVKNFVKLVDQGADVNIQDHQGVNVLLIFCISSAWSSIYAQWGMPPLWQLCKSLYINYERLSTEKHRN